MEYNKQDLEHHLINHKESVVWWFVLYCLFITILIHSEQCNLVNQIELKARCEHKEAEKLAAEWSKFFFQDLWSVVLPHELYKHFDSVLFKHNIVALTSQEFNEVVCIFTIKNPVKVQSLHCDSSVVVCRAISTQLKLKFLFHFLISFFNIYKFLKCNKKENFFKGPWNPVNKSDELFFDPDFLILCVPINLIIDLSLINERSLTGEHDLLSIIWPIDNKW